MLRARHSAESWASTTASSGPAVASQALPPKGQILPLPTWASRLPRRPSSSSSSLAGSGSERASSSSPTPPPSPAGGRRGVSPSGIPPAGPHLEAQEEGADISLRDWQAVARTEAARRAESTSGHCPNPTPGPGEPGGQSPLPPPLLLHPHDTADDHSAHRARSNEDAAPAAAASEITPAAEATPAGGAAAGTTVPRVRVVVPTTAGAATLPLPGTPRSSVTQLMQQASASEFEVAFNLTGESIVLRGQRAMVGGARDDEWRGPRAMSGGAEWRSRESGGAR